MKIIEMSILVLLISLTIFKSYGSINDFSINSIFNNIGHTYVKFEEDIEDTNSETIEYDNELLLYFTDKIWKYEDDAQWKLTFDTNTIHVYLEDACWYTEYKYDMVELNTEEKYIILNINKELEGDEEGMSEKEVDYINKILLNNDVLYFISRYGTDDEVISRWILEE